MKRVLAIMLFSLLLLTLSSTTLFAVIYKYIDENGTTVFVDDKSKIPQKDHGKVSSMKESTDGMSTADRKAPEEELLSQQELDEEEPQMSSQERRKAKAQLKNETAVHVANNRIIVPVKVTHGGKSANLNLLLDTGANVTVVYSSAIERLRFSKRKKVSAQLAGGSKVTSARVVFDGAKIGPYNLEDVPIWILEDTRNTSEDGLLGMDFLSKHGYKVDLDRSVIIWGD